MITQYSIDLNAPQKILETYPSIINKKKYDVLTKHIKPYYTPVNELNSKDLIDDSEIELNFDNFSDLDD